MEKLRKNLKLYLRMYVKIPMPTSDTYTQIFICIKKSLQ